MRLVLLTALLAASAAAQPSPASSPAVRGVATLGATMQRYTLADEPALSQVSVPLSVGVRHASGLGLGLRTIYMTSESDVLAPMSGLSDVQLTASMRRRFGPAAVEASLGASVPAGGGTLAPDAFATASALALDDFGFDVTSLGSGSAFAFAPALTVAVAAGPSAAVGVGVSYVARGAYEPFEGDAARYAPADEFALSAGLDARLGSASSVALDVTTVGFGEDVYDGRTYRPGRRVAATMRVVAGGSLIRWHLLARYRHVFDGEAPAAGGATRPVPEVRPQHARLVTGFDVGPDAGGVDLTLGARYYGTIDVPDDPLEILDVLGEQQVIVDAGVSPRVRLTPTAVLRATFVYSRGVLSGIDGVDAPALVGFRAGGGVSVAF